MNNGLFFVKVEPAGGGRAENGGVLVLRNGRILGGDAFFYYVGEYSGADGRWTGQFSTKVHTRSDLAVPVFGGKEVAVTFSGTYADNSADAEATSTTEDGVRAYRLSLRLIADA